MTPSDSVASCSEGLSKAVFVIKQLKTLNDSIFMQSTAKMQEMDVAYTTVAGKHFLGIILGLLFFAVIVGFFIWKARKLYRSYESLVALTNVLLPKYQNMQELCKSYDEDFAVEELPSASVKSIWPRFYIHIIYGPFLLFILIYFFVAF